MASSHSVHPSIIGLATPTVLLIPIQPIQPSQFTTFIKAIQPFSLPETDQKTDQKTLQLLLNFAPIQSFSPSATYHQFLHAFQLHRKPFGIIAIVDCARYPAHNQTLQDALNSFELLLASHYPRTPVRTCFGFYPPGSKPEPLNGLVLIPNVDSDLQKRLLKQSLSQFTSDLVRSFQHLSSVLQSTSSIETPTKFHHSTLFDSIPILPPLNSNEPDLPPDPSTSTTSNQPSSSKFLAPKARQPISHMLNNIRLSPEPSSPMVDGLDSPQAVSSPMIANSKSETYIPTSPSHLPLDLRARKKHIGRIRKLEADLELLAARPVVALKIYIEAISHLKLVNDYVWWAAALEGLAVAKILSLLAGSVYENSVREILETLELAVETYSKALSRAFDGSVLNGNPEVVEPLVYVESVVRLLDFKLELLDLDNKQLEREDVDQLRILLGNHLSRHHWKPDRFKHLSSEICLDINRIGSMIELAVGGLHFVEDRIRALSKLVSVFESIGFVRKVGWFKRELVGVIVEQVVRFGGSIPWDGKQAIVKLIEEVCSSFRISVDQSAHQPIVVDYRLGVLEQAQPGWRELQLGVLMDAVIACNQLDENLHELRFRFKLNEFLDHHEPHGLEIKDDDRRINWLLKSLFQPSLNYWGPKNIILTIELLPLPSRSAVVSHLKRIPLQANTQNNGPHGLPTKPTFYYSHNQMPTGLSKAKELYLKMVKDEPITVLVTLQNPMTFDLEISMICLSTTGIAFEAVKTQTVIKTRTIKTIPLTGVPLSTGTLKIKGCQIQLIGSQEPQEFILPIGKPKLKKTDEEQLISCQVVDPMPFLRISGGCEQVLGSSGVMVYDGETTTIEIKILNTSKVRADWIDVTVQDNLTEQIRKRLDEQTYQLGEFERHQIEYELVNRPVLRVVDKSETIEAGQNGRVRLRCLGKIGCRSLGVRMDYGVEFRSSGTTHFKRQLDINLGLSVQKSLKVVGFETLPAGLILIKVLNSAQAGQVFHVQAKGGKVGSNPFIMDSQKHILRPGSTHSFLIEIEPIQITQTNAEKLIPHLIERQFIINHHQHHQQKRAIKDKGKDQDDRKKSDDDEDVEEAETADIRKRRHEETERLKYLIKEEVLKLIKIEWREVGSSRTGEISLRKAIEGFDDGLQFISNLRTDQVALDLSFVDPPSPLVVQADQFCRVRITAKNLSGVKRKVDIQIKVMREDGSMVGSSENMSRSPGGKDDGVGKSARGGAAGGDGAARMVSNYLIRGTVIPAGREGEAGMRTIVMADGREGPHLLDLELAFFSSGSFHIQALALLAHQLLPPAAAFHALPPVLLGLSNSIPFRVS